MRNLIIPLALLVLLVSGCGRKTQTVEVDTEGTEAIPAEISIEGLQEVLPQAWMIYQSDKGWKFVPAHMKDLVVDPDGFRFSYPRFKDPVVYRFENIVRINLKTDKKFWHVELERVLDEKKSTVVLYYLEENAAKKAMELLESLRRKAN